MRMTDLIQKKKTGNTLTTQELTFIIQNYTSGSIPDYQMSAFLMAVYFKGMTSRETADFTLAMANSGDTADLSAINGKKVDKHSTGGVGDKTTLIISPIVASAGIPVAKMSGRGLGHTGGTIDKLESIPGLRTSFTSDEFTTIVNSVGICVAGQSGQLAPADKKIYALRDVTATVDNISLIAASIMSKKIASGSDCILLDVKTGSGAFMKTVESSVELAKEMIAIGEAAGRHTAALITDMDTPLGFAIGNSLEVIEAIETLKGKGPSDLTKICLELSKNMLYLAGVGDIDHCEEIAHHQLYSGNAFNKLLEMVHAQGGDKSYIENPSLFPRATIQHSVKAPKSGYIYKTDTEGMGIASCILGAGRETENAKIDFTAGIMLNAKTGDYVKQGDTISILHTNNKEAVNNAEEKLLASIEISDLEPKKKPLIYAIVDKDKVSIFE